MKRLIFALPILFFMTSPARPAEKVQPLQIEGETALVVTKVPFKLICPEKGHLYDWQLPAYWKTRKCERGRVVEVLEAQSGKYEVRLSILRFEVDFEKKDIKEVYKDFQMTVVLQTAPLPPPAPPTPPTPPSPSSFSIALEKAYTAETDPQKATHIRNLAVVYREAATVVASRELTTWGQLYTAVQAGARQAGVAGKISAIQGVVSTELLRYFAVDPRSQPNVQITPEQKTTLQAVFAQIAQTLEGVAK